MFVLITICARGGSKGVPGKNIKPMAGKPLLYYSLEHATHLVNILGDGHIAISTDDDAIKAAAKAEGFLVEYQRPPETATDSAPKYDALYDIWKWAEAFYNVTYDFIIDLDVSSPLRRVRDVLSMLELLKSRPDAMNIFSVTQAHRNPYFNMVEVSQEGFARLVKQGAFDTRQSTPLVYDMDASVYVYRRRYFAENIRKVINEHTLCYPVSHHSFDIDTPMDFEIMNHLVTNGFYDDVLNDTPELPK